MAKVSSITSLIFHAIPLIEKGVGESVSVKEIEEHINKGDILLFLQQRFPFEKGGIDLSLFLESGSYANEKTREVTNLLQFILPAYEGRERRKMGVTKNGLCFLVGLCAEIIQQGEWKSPRT